MSDPEPDPEQSRPPSRRRRPPQPPQQQGPPSHLAHLESEVRHARSRFDHALNKLLSYVSSGPTSSSSSSSARAPVPTPPPTLSSLVLQLRARLRSHQRRLFRAYSLAKRNRIALLREMDLQRVFRNWIWHNQFESEEVVLLPFLRESEYLKKVDIVFENEGDEEEEEEEGEEEGERREEDDDDDDNDDAVDFVMKMSLKEMEAEVGRLKGLEYEIRTTAREYEETAREVGEKLEKEKTRKKAFMSRLQRKLKQYEPTTTATTVPDAAENLEEEEEKEEEEEEEEKPEPIGAWLARTPFSSAWLQSSEGKPIPEWLDRVLKKKRAEAEEKRRREAAEGGPGTEGEVDPLQGISAKDHEYFSSYENIAVHSTMLSDTTRNMSYYNAMLGNPADFEGKVVLDVGSGTGILSLMAASAGAKRIYAVECTTMANAAKDLIADHVCHRDRIQVINKRIEDVVLEEKVDVIISEWMGFALLVENMLASVLHARDNFLKPGGLLYPHTARLYLIGVYHPAPVNSVFDDPVCGFDFRLLNKMLDSSATRKVRAESVVTESVLLREFDLMTCTRDDLTFSEEFCLKAKPDAPLHLCGALAMYFEVDFGGRSEGGKKIMLSTSPFEPLTHWLHKRMTLDFVFDLSKGEKTITGKIEVNSGSHETRLMMVNFDATCGKKSVHQEYAF